VLEPTPVGGEGADWKAAFEDMGVKWPKGSSIKYVSAMGKLIVANTDDNLTVFEQILEQLNVVPNQVEIEARFVEVSQSDLDSLGFEWFLTDDYEIAYMKQDAHLPPEARRRIVMPANSQAGGFTAGNRFLRNDAGLSAEGVTDNILTFAGLLTNPELAMTLHALRQKGSTDLLSAPKIMTQSGAEATIKVVTEYVYPTDFEVTPITGTTGTTGLSSILGGVVEPSDFQTRDVGVILSVLPEVNPEGQMINLTMTPEVVSEPIWKNYGTTYSTQADPNNTTAASQTQTLNMEQPFFFVRTISTQLVIYNGSTVVMGGMITETRNEVDDKIPFLGDIPLIGRLFRSHYEKSEKRNLLIFVTARLVDPAGRPLKRPDLSSL
jgi:general secretion pathway protein D